MLLKHLIPFIFILGATISGVMMQYQEKTESGDYITYIGPFQLISGASADTDQLLRFVGSIQPALAGYKPAANVDIFLGHQKSGSSSFVLPPINKEPPQPPTTTVEEPSKTKVEIHPETVVPAPEATTEKVVETTIAHSTETPATTIKVPYHGPAETKPEPVVEIPSTTETPTTEAAKTHHHQHELVPAPVPVHSTEKPLAVEAPVQPEIKPSTVNHDLVAPVLGNYPTYDRPIQHVEQTGSTYSLPFSVPAGGENTNEKIVVQQATYWPSPPIYPIKASAEPVVEPVKGSPYFIQSSSEPKVPHQQPEEEKRTYRPGYIALLVNKDSLSKKATEVPQFHYTREATHYQTEPEYQIRNSEYEKVQNRPVTTAESEYWKRDWEERQQETHGSNRYVDYRTPRQSSYPSPAEQRSHYHEETEETKYIIPDFTPRFPDQRPRVPTHYERS